MKILTHKNIKITFLAISLINLFVLIINLSKPIVVYRGNNAAYRFIEAILKEHKCCKKVIKNILTTVLSYLVTC